MKRLATIAFAGLIACCGLAAGAGAQEARDIFKEPDQQLTLLYATQLIEQAGLHAESIAAMAQVPGVETVNVAALPREASRHVFEETMSRFLLRNREEIGMLHHALMANDVVAEALADAGVEPTSVVAAEIRPDLALRVYIRDW